MELEVGPVWNKADNSADSNKVDLNDWLSTRIAHEGQKNHSVTNRSSKLKAVYTTATDPQPLPRSSMSSATCGISGYVFTPLLQPPSADPHARWCGEGRSDAGPYPIMPRRSGKSVGRLTPVSLCSVLRSFAIIKFSGMEKIIHDIDVGAGACKRRCARNPTCSKLYSILRC